jgi:hypothetical protein
MNPTNQSPETRDKEPRIKGNSKIKPRKTKPKVKARIQSLKATNQKKTNSRNQKQEDLTQYHRQGDPGAGIAIPACSIRAKAHQIRMRTGYDRPVDTLVPALIGATIAAVGVVLFALQGRGESGPQTPAEHALRTRVATRLAFVFLAVLGIACPLAATLGHLEAAAAIGVALAIVLALAVGVRRERDRVTAGSR